MLNMDEDPLRPEALLEHRDAVRSLARILVKDAHLADDLAQSTFVRAIEHPPRSGAAASIRAWLRSVLRNEARQEHRKELRRRAREIATAARSNMEATDPLAQTAAKFEAQLVLMNAVKRLDPAHREVILLRFFEDLPPRKIAARLEVPVKTIDSRLARALAHLRRELDATERGDRAAWLASLVPLCSTSIPPIAAVFGVLTVKAFSIASVAVLALVAAVLWKTNSGHTEPIGGTSKGQENARAPAVVSDEKPALVAPEVERTAMEAPATPADPPSTPTSVVYEQAGRFLDPSGAPIPGVVLTATSSSGPMDNAIGSATATSDPAGRFVFRVGEGEFNVACKDAGYALIGDPEFYVGETASSTPLIVLGAPAAKISGVVVDEDSRPIGGAGLRLTFDDRIYVALGTDAARTRVKGFLEEAATDGTFTIDHVPATKGITIEALAAGFSSASRTIDEFPARDLRFVLKHTLLERGKLDGIVRGKLGEPLPDVRLGLDGVPTSSDAEGHFHFEYDLKSPPEQLMAATKGFLPVRMDHPGPAAAPWPEFVELRIAEEPLSMSGIVLDQEGKPLEKARVWLAEATPLASSEQGFWIAENVVRGGGMLRIEATADDHGRFRLEGLLDRDYELLAIDPHRAWIVEGGVVHAGRKDVVIRFPKGELREKLPGRIVDRHGAPVVGATVYVEVMILAAKDANGMRFCDSALGSSAVTDDEGRFELVDVPSRDVKLRVDRTDMLDSNVFPLPPRDSVAPLVLTVSLSREVRLDLVDKTMTEFTMLDAMQHPLKMYRHERQSVTSFERGKIFEGGSEVITVSDAAEWIVFYDGMGKETRRPIQLKAGEINVIR